MPKAIFLTMRRFVLLFFMAGVFAAPSVTVLASFRPDAQTVEAREKWINERQPPARVMDAIGLKPGMVVGEVGAGRGRYTIHLAARVGPAGHVYANDINADGLAVLRERCRKDGLENVETILGSVDNPLFPKKSLDLVFMVLTYHHLARPVDLMKNLLPSLKPGATVVVIDPDPAKDPGEPQSEYTPREKIEREAAEAGFVIDRVETFLPRDGLFILKAREKGGLPPHADPGACLR
jgi:SAM-dependent methyltransferase